MKTRIIGSIVALGLASSAAATTVAVDGVGFSTISAALASLGVDGRDGAPDVINVTIDNITESAGILIDANALATSQITDSITINGNADANANKVLIVASGFASINGGNYAIGLRLQSNQTVTLNDLQVIPVDNAATTAQTAAAGVLMVDEADAAVINNVTVNVQRCVFSASTLGNALVDPSSAAPTDVTRFRDTSGNGANVGWGSSPVTSTNLTFNLIDSTVAHGQQDQVWFYQDAASGNVVNITRSLITRGVGLVGAGAGLIDGLGASTAENLVVNVRESAFTFHDEHGITTVNGGATSRATLNLLEGTLVASNSFRGVESAAVNGNVNFIGSEGKPAVVRDNGNRGVRFANGGARVPQISWTQVVRNQVQGFELNEVDLQNNPPVFTKCLFAHNGTSAVTPIGQVRVGDTNTLAGSVTFNDSTFHDVGFNATAKNFAAEHAHILQSAGGSDLITYNINRSVFSDTANTTLSNDDRAFYASAGDNTTVNATNSGLPSAGTYAINATPIANLAAATGFTANNTNPVTADPQYLSVDTGTVNAPALNYRAFVVSGTAASGYNNSAGANVSGYGKFAPVLGFSGLTFTQDGNPADWTTDVALGAGAARDFQILGSSQAVWTDTTGDNTGDGDFASPTDGAFLNSGVDIREVRVAQDSNSLRVLVVTNGSSPSGFGANFETQGGFVALNYNTDGSNQFIFQDAKMTVRPELVHDTHVYLNETAAGVQSFGNATGSQAAQDEANSAFEFLIPKSALPVGTTTFDVVVGLGHTSGSNFRNVNDGAPGAFDGGFGASSVRTAGSENPRLYDLAGAESAQGQIDDYVNTSGPAGYPMNSNSFLTIVSSIPVPVSLSGFELE